MSGRRSSRPVVRLALALVMLTLTSCSSDPTPTEQFSGVTASLGGAPRSLPAGFYGLNGANFLRGVDPADPRLLTALGSLRPPTIRVFGGTTANYWQWRSGKLTTEVELPRDLGNLDPVGVPLERWKELLDAAGAAPLFDLNIVTSTLDDQLAMLSAARRLGMPVDRVELGNELYVNQPEIIERFPTAAAYRDEARRWISALKDAYPDVQVAVVGALQRQGNTLTDRKMTWNEEVAAADGAADAVTLHLYFGSGLDGDATIDDEAAAQVVAKTSDRLDEFRKDDLGGLPAGTACWVTEFNLFDRDTLVPGSWLHGLVAAQTAIGLTAEPRVGFAAMHALVGNPTFAALFEDAGKDGESSGGSSTSAGGAGAGFLGAQRSGEPFAATAAGATMGLLFHAADGTTSVQQLEMRSEGQGLETIAGLVFDTPSGRHLFVANLSANTADVELGDLGRLAGERTTLAAAPGTFVKGPGSLDRDGGAASAVISVPPWSVTVIA